MVDTYSMLAAPSSERVGVFIVYSILLEARDIRIILPRGCVALAKEVITHMKNGDERRAAHGWEHGVVPRSSVAVQLSLNINIAAAERALARGR